MEQLPLFIAASIALIITPGPDIIYVLTRGIADGRRAGVMSAIGVTFGILFHTVAASLGLALLLQTSVYAFWALKIIGGIYLIYLGIQIIKNKKGYEIKEFNHHFDTKKCLIQGFLSNVLNPKVALFFVAFLPQFVSVDVQDNSIYLIILGLIFALMTIVFLTILGLFSGVIGTWLQERRKAAGRIRIGSGVIIMVLGFRLLISQKH